MNENKLSEFKLVCKNYFSTLRLSTLYCYGRFLQLRAPTAMKKADLIESIIGVLCGEILPQRNLRGAPIKGNYIDQSIFETVKLFQKQYLYEEPQKNNENTPEIDEPFIGNQSQTIAEFSNMEEQIPSPVQCVIQISKLNKEQKKLFFTFLESL